MAAADCSGYFSESSYFGSSALRLLHAGFGDLPEVRRAVDDEGEALLFLSLRRTDAVNATIAGYTTNTMRFMQPPWI